mgnify:CR=1 FL=1
MKYHDRVNFYLGKQLIQENFEVNKTVLNIHTLPRQNNDGYNRNYIVPLNLLVEKTHNSTKKFAYTLGDVEGYTSPEKLCKNRMSGCTDGVILRCLNYNRHWSLFYNKPKDIPFDKKKNIIFWRGTTTGQIDRIGNRFDLVKRWFNKNKHIDVGFSSICQNKNDFKNYVKNIIMI